MDSLIIDIETFILPNIEILPNFTRLTRDCQNGIMLIIPKNITTTLDNLTPGINRIKYLDSQHFIGNINAIITFTYHHDTITVYDIQKLKSIRKNKLCKLMNSGFSMNFPIGITLLISPKENYIFPLLNAGWKYTKNDDMYLDNILLRTYPTKSDVMTEYRSTNSPPNVYKIPKGCMNNLEMLVDSGNRVSPSGEIYQCEVAGAFKVSKIGKGYISLKINPKTVIMGDIDTVEMVKGYGTFHTHPRELYTKYGVSLGWPSGQDYYGFHLALDRYKIKFHIVATLEGVYVIQSVKKTPITSEEYHISRPKGLPNIDENIIHQYLEKINSLGVFNVTFGRWHDSMYINTS
jgi:hypothetical protein